MPKKPRASDGLVMFHFFRGTVLIFMVGGPLLVLLAPFTGVGGLIVGVLMVYAAVVFYSLVHGRPTKWIAEYRLRLTTRVLLTSGFVVVILGMIFLTVTIVGYFFAATLSYVFRSRRIPTSSIAPAQPKVADGGPSLADQWVDRSRALYPDEGEEFRTHLSTHNFRRPSPFEYMSRSEWETEYRRYEDLAVADTSPRNRAHVERLYTERLEHYRREIRAAGPPGHWVE